ncbi:hypothetical protein TNCV_1579691 [Trichonephila clavipes]|nr:hypothetical protein TNCV_1579691 [Trichonephila clavipes]
MTENDAPESTRARIGLSIITSSWLPSHLGGRREDFMKVALFVFLAPTAWRLTRSAIWRRGSVTTYWDFSWDFGVKRRRRVWSAYFSSFLPTSSVPSAASCQRQPFSRQMRITCQDVRSGNKQVCCQPFSTHLFFLVQVGISEQELCISWLQRRMLVVV